MKLKTFMIINAIVAVIVGILLIFIPSLIVRALGLPADRGMDLDGQLYGSELILMGLVAWIARDISDIKYERRIFGAFFVANLISLIISVLGVVTRTFDSVGWVAVVAYLLLTAVYGGGYLSLPQREMAQQKQADQPS